jgi:hypothetical protein
MFIVSLSCLYLLHLAMRINVRISRRII